MILIPLLRLIESQINNRIIRMPEAVAYCEKIKGKRIHVSITDIRVSFQLSALADGIALTPLTQASDATICGSVRDFVRFVKEPDATDVDVHIEGNARTVQAFQKLLTMMQLDIEEIMAQQFGDTFGVPAARGFQGARRGAKRVAAGLKRSTTEFFEFEADRAGLSPHSHSDTTRQVLTQLRRSAKEAIAALKPKGAR